MTLSRLLGEGRPLDAPVATGDAGSRDFARFGSDVSALAGALRRAAGGPLEAPRWVVCCDDSYAFAVALFGVWQAGGIAISPPNAQPGTLAGIDGEPAGFLSDAEALPVEPGSGPLLDPLHPPETPSEPIVALGREAWALELFTSGTTGAGRRVRKRLRHLEDEVAWLERRFGPELGPAEIFATASHQHLYGLLFRVLWPLAAGRPFRADTFLHAEELVPRIASAGRAVLASTPAHLRRLVEHAELAKLGPACRAVFSSGGPLDPETADRLTAALGRPPVEIFGSTETGGVAWRAQLPGDERFAFTPFDAVSVERSDEGLLRVRSPYADQTDAPSGLLLGDRVTLLESGRFLVGDRADRVVKVGEKRLSLPDMEAELRGHPEVADAALLRIGAEGAGRIAAAVVLGAAGRARLEREGRRAVSAALGEFLAGRFDRALLPRSWRYVDRVPEDSQGKRTAALLGALFAERDAPTTEPRLLAERRSADRIERELEVHSELVYFDGHFPVSPILPGIVELAWAADAARALLGAEPRIAAIEALKFGEPVRPGDRLRLEVQRGPGRLAFRILRGPREVASGRLVLRDPDASRATGEEPA
jgi:acyl-coenzyme A synthetase/AMP-(fatty) acid ligase